MTEADLTQQFDAAVWADEWLNVLGQKPQLPWDRNAMIGWFANAIMAGYDHAKRQQTAGADIETTTPSP